MTDTLAEQSDCPVLLFDKTDQGQNAYIASAQAALRIGYGQMTEIIRSPGSRRLIVTADRQVAILASGNQTGATAARTFSGPMPIASV